MFFQGDDIRWQNAEIAKLQEALKLALTHSPELYRVVLSDEECSPDSAVAKIRAVLPRADG